jgi:hypothetical protein
MELAGRLARRLRRFAGELAGGSVERRAQQPDVRVDRALAK